MLLAIKKVLKQLLPTKAIYLYRKYNFKKRMLKMQGMTTVQKFDYIYKNNLWGKKSNIKYYSGEGSHKKEIICPYIDAIKSFLNNFDKPVIVDLGCGDFNVGSQLLHLSKKYYAIDIVKSLIDTNKLKFKKDNLIFSNLDISTDNLPSGDVCLVRQVLTHLSNAEIKSFIKNIRDKYKFLVVTENIPEGRFEPNLDMETNFSTRHWFNSGVVLHEYPFNLKIKKSNIILEVPAFPALGLIQTIVYVLI